MNEHVRWDRRRESNSVQAGYESAKRAYELGQAVRSRRRLGAALSGEPGSAGAAPGRPG
jgi:hypothetical protein